MAARPVLTVPDPILRQVCTPVEVFNQSLAELTDDMLASMYDAKGRGLAAPQIGVTQRVFVMDSSWKEGAPAPLVFVNPEILARSEETSTYEEGCLSIPGKTTHVRRPSQVTVAWKNVTGESEKRVFDGFAATCIQHEIDHLNGILCTDYEGTV